MQLKQPKCLSSLKLIKKLVSKDKTEKYIWETQDKNSIETVFVTLAYRKIPRVVCVSSQIGCPVGCQFCATGRNFVRNLSVSEIADQVFDVLKHRGERTSSEEEFKFEISFMSMGEPLLNLRNVRQAIHKFDQELFGQIEVTVSTVGIVPGIYELGSESFSCNVDLQISLHAANQKNRENLIPKCRFKLNEILEAAEWYSEVNRRKVCINYLLIRDINDSKTDCRNLINILDPKHFYIKLSQLNVQGNQHIPADVKRVKIFENLLHLAGFETKIFKSHGIDINAGCGQLPSGSIKSKVTG